MNTFDLQQLLDRWDWKVEFDGRTLFRAAGYYRHDQVLPLQHAADGDGDALRGTVMGNRPKPYTCTLRIRCDDDLPELDSDCSCPVGYWCKHAAAVMMVATETPHELWPHAGAGRTESVIAAAATPASPHHAPHPEPLLAWKRWLHDLEAAPRSTPSRTAEAERQFGLLLRAGTDGIASTLQVNPVWLRRSRRVGDSTAGKLVDPQPLQPDRYGPFPTPPAGWPSDVAAALTVLMHGNSEWIGQRWWAIATNYQEDALLTLLAKYPIFLERASAPARRSRTPGRCRCGCTGRTCRTVASDCKPMWMLTKTRNCCTRRDGCGTCCRSRDASAWSMPIRHWCRRWPAYPSSGPGKPLRCASC